MKLVIIILLALLFSSAYIIYLLRKQPSEVVFVPMQIEVEEEGYEIDPAEVQASWEFMQKPGIDPDRPH